MTASFAPAIAAWIEDEFVPQMVKEGKLKVENQTPDDEVKIRAVHAHPLEISGFALSTPFKVHVELYTFANPSRVTAHNLVVKKTPPLPPEMFKGAQFEALFTNEAIAYTQIIPMLSNKEKYPKYYYSETKPTEATLAMEDFSYHGWKMSNSVVNLSLDHILCAVTELGAFHGEMYALKESKPDIFHNIASKLIETRYANMDITYQIIMKASVGRAIKSVKESKFKEKVPAEFLDQLNVLLADDPKAYGWHSVQPVEPLAVITHSDFLRNNIAFKYENDDPSNKPIDAMMFDMQTMRYCSPAIDLVTLLANSAMHEIRAPNLELVLKTYHDKICSILKAKIGKIPEKYSFENFYREYVKYLPYGLHISTSFLSMMLDPIENLHELMSDKFTPERVHEIIEFMSNRGGEVLNTELAHQIYECFELYQKFNLKL